MRYDPKRKRKGPGSYDQLEKSSILSRYDELRKTGQTIPYIVPELGISVATLYRWLSERSEAYTARQSNGALAAVENAIATLIGGDVGDRLKYIEAIFVFVVWLRWPQRPDYMPVGMACYLSAYFLLSQSGRFLDDLHTEESNLLGKYLRLSDIRDICIGRNFDFPVYENYAIDEQPFDDRDVLAGIYWTLVAVGKKSADSRKHASLSKSFYLIQTNAMPFEWIVGRRTLDKFWKEFRVVTPFLYIERYHSPLLWSLEPSQSDIVEYVNDIMIDPARVVTYFRRCKGAISSLKEILDHRALEGVIFPRFPAGIAEEPVQAPDLTDKIKQELESYGRSSKYLR